MAAGVVDDLELIEVHVQQCVIGAAVLPIVNGELQPAFEFAPNVEQLKMALKGINVAQPGIL